MSEPALLYDSLWLTPRCAHVRGAARFTISTVHHLSHILKSGLCFARHSRRQWTPTSPTAMDRARPFEAGGSVYLIDFIKLSLPLLSLIKATAKSHAILLPLTRTRRLNQIGFLLFSFVFLHSYLVFLWGASGQHPLQVPHFPFATTQHL